MAEGAPVPIGTPNAGTHEVRILVGDRTITGLHVCENCVFILMGAFDRPLVGPSPWTGPCDLCRYTAALASLLSRGMGDD